ncbi:MAG: DUF1194 domain-containing protein [Pseudomonadota bacterium]
MDKRTDSRSTRTMRTLRSGLVALAALTALVVPARSETPVDVELILAVDVSRSMTARELEIQRRGYAEALVSDEVVQAITLGGLHGKVALTYVEWAGSYSQRVIVDWTLVESREGLEAFAAKLTANFNTSLRRTSISGIIDYSIPRFEENGFKGMRRVIDISGDGPNNDGRAVLSARADAASRGITINGLPLMTQEGLGSQWHLDDLDEYYRHCVITGPAAFVIPVREWQDFPDAVRQKLILELAGLKPKEARVERVSGYDCLIGEKIWDRFFGDWN